MNVKKVFKETLILPLVIPAATVSEEAVAAVGNVDVWGGSVDAWGRSDSGSPAGTALQRWVESAALEAMQEKGREVWERSLAKWQPNKAFADCLVKFHAGTTREIPPALLKEHFSGLAKVFADAIMSYQVTSPIPRLTLPWVN